MTDHVIQVRYTKDAGNWTSYRDLNAGRVGAFGQELVTRQLGQATARVWEICDTSPFAADILAAAILDATGNWADFPLPDGSYSDLTRDFTQQDVVDYIPLPAQQTGTRSRVLYRTAPGLDVFASIGDGPHRGAINAEGALFIVSGSSLYEVATDGTATSRGTIPGTGRVSMAYNQITGGNQVVVGNGSSGYVYNTYTDTFTQITDAGFPGFKSCDFLNQYIVGVEPLGRYWFHSELNDALSYNTLDQYQAETSPDPIQGLIASHNEVLVFGSRTIEPWINDPVNNAAATAFQLERGSVIERGCLNGNTIRRLDNSVFFIGDDRVPYRLNGYTPVPIGTPVLASAWRDLDPTRAFAFTYEDRGHVVYYVTWGDGQTWGYDVVTGKWHRRQSFGLDRWRLNSLVKWGNEWYGGDFQNGKLYRVAWGYVYEGCEIMPRRIRTGVLHSDGNPVSVGGFKVLASTGGPESTLPSSLVPTISGALPDGTVDDVIDYTYTVTPAFSGQEVTLTVEGTFPPGLTLTSAGHVTGTLTTAGTYSFTITPSSDCGSGAALADVVTVVDNGSSAILSDAPILYWKLNETSGTNVVDYSGYSRDGTITGSPTLSNSGITLTALAQGVYYPGNAGGSVLDVGGDDTWAIEAVITRSADGGSVHEHIAGQWASTAFGHINSMLYLEGSSVPADLAKPSGAFTGSISSTLYKAMGPTAIANGTRTHLMIVRTGTTLVLYKNGAQIATTTVGTAVGMASTGAKFTVGSDADTVNYYPTSYGFLGKIEHVAVYDQAISAARVLYHAQMHGLA
jgi:hypothetical protein